MQQRSVAGHWVHQDVLVLIFLLEMHMEIADLGFSRSCHLGGRAGVGQGFPNISQSGSYSVPSTFPRTIKQYLLGISGLWARNQLHVYSVLHGSLRSFFFYFYYFKQAIPNCRVCEHWHNMFLRSVWCQCLNFKSKLCWVFFGENLSVKRKKKILSSRETFVFYVERQKYVTKIHNTSSLSTHIHTHRHVSLHWWLYWDDNNILHTNAHTKRPPVLPHTYKHPTQPQSLHYISISALMVSSRVKKNWLQFHGCPANLLCKVTAAYIRGEVGLEVWCSQWCSILILCDIAQIKVKISVSY